MPNYLNYFGLGPLIEDEKDMKALLAQVIREGNLITGYYGIPYVNYHQGDVQMIARLERKNENGDKPSYTFSGLDVHCRGRSVWEVRIVEELDTPDGDPLSRRLFLKSVDGNSPFIADIVNADVIPSFLKDEVIKLQMMAFSERISFFENEDAYRETVKPGLNGQKTTIGSDMVFPVGLFADKDEPEVKDLVQIHGTVEKVFWGKLDAGKAEGEELRTFIICRVKTQYGNIEIVENADAIDPVFSKHMHPGAVADCMAYLCGDPAIFELDHGIVRNAENNLKLVAYTLEKGDQERLRTVLADDFVYHSDHRNRNLEGADAYIEFLKYVRREGTPCRAYYATITGHKEEEPEYPAGTRCLVLKYEGDNGYDSIVFVDQDESGKIRRILISMDDRYSFRIDPKMPETDAVNDLLSDSMLPVRETMFNRASMFGLFSPNTTQEFIEKTLEKNVDRFRNALVPVLSGEEITRESFGEAFFLGVRLSGVEGCDDEEIHQIGEMFHTDALYHSDEGNRDEVFREELPFVMAMGSLYEGRVDEHRWEEHLAYLMEDGIGEAIEEHLMKYRACIEKEAEGTEKAAGSCPDPCGAPNLREEYADVVTVDGIKYERYADCAGFSVCGTDNVPKFCFYTLYRADDIPNHLDDEFRDARKLFQTENLNPEDFPDARDELIAHTAEEEQA